MNDLSETGALVDVAQEEWREVAGYPNYRVSNMGRVMSNYAWGTRGKTGEWRQLNLYINSDGYAQTALSIDGKAENFYVHTLVLEAFVGPKPEGLIGCHGNGMPSDNRLSNLRWDTYQGNSDDMTLHGTRLHGERIATAKLTVGQVGEIRDLLQAGGMTQREIARRFSISEQTICDIKHERRWTKRR